MQGTGNSEVQSPLTERVSGFFGRVDARLASIPDRGDRINFLNSLLTTWERRRADLSLWAANDSDAPNPLGKAADVFEVDATISGLLKRRDELAESARADALRLARAL